MTKTTNYKFNINDKVKWNDGKYHNNNKRIDVITGRGQEFLGGGNYYMTKEVNQPQGQKAKIGKAQECYLVLV